MLSATLCVGALESISRAARFAPNIASLWQRSSANITPRDDSDLGIDCGGDPDCVTTPWGCECGFEDGGWVTDEISADDPGLS